MQDHSGGPDSTTSDLTKLFLALDTSSPSPSQSTTSEIPLTTDSTADRDTISDLPISPVGQQELKISEAWSIPSNQQLVVDLTGSVPMDIMEDIKPKPKTKKSRSKNQKLEKCKSKKVNQITLEKIFNKRKRKVKEKYQNFVHQLKLLVHYWYQDLVKVYYQV